MKNIWYNIIKVYVSIGLFFLHKKIKVYGTHNIPKKGAVIFIGNHQNALIDALLIPTTNNRVTHFLTRASAFKNSLADKFLRTVNMIPVYRIRDGRTTIEKNYEVFEQCVEILKEGKALEIFAEGEHHLKRRILPLKKGFARIILSTLKKYPTTEIKIIPVGLNYDSHLNFPASASIYYGKPILANNFFNPETAELKFAEITKAVVTNLKQLTLHINHDKDYDTTIEKLEQMGVDFLNPFEVNKIVKKGKFHKKHNTKQSSKYNWLAPIHFLVKLNSIIPLAIWKYFKLNIKEVIFTNTFRFALITTIFPLFYILQTGLVYYYFNETYAVTYLTCCIILGILTTKTMRVS